MDHIPYPIHKLSRQPIQVPYICDSRFSYDDQGFLTYPYRAGVDLIDLCNNDVAFSPSVMPFFQAWLWFGLLSETLGIGSRTHAKQKSASFEVFIKILPDGQKVLSTTELHAAVMRRRETSRLPSMNDTFRSRFDSYLITAAQAVNAILQTPACQRQLSEAQSLQVLEMPYLVLLSIQILIESLRSYRGILFSSGLHHDLPRIQFPELRPDLLRILLAEAKWCPFEIKSIKADLQVQFLLSSVFKVDHDDQMECSQEACSRWNINSDKISPQHSTNECLCEMIETPDELIEIAAQENMIPILTFTDHDGGKRELKIQKIPLRHPVEEPFVAFSHVRSRGLGNTFSHGLPYCQLSLLQEIANDTIRSSSKPTPFYIDTIGIPLSPDKKKPALMELFIVFEKAAAVVVWDPSLMNSITGSEVETLLRIRYSDWKRRLWTLQEGAVARRLLFRFANGTYDLDEVLNRFESEAPFSILSRVLETTEPYLDYTLHQVRVQRFDRDLKIIPDIDAVGGHDALQKLRGMLRLGYLGLPRYRYIVEEDERIQSVFVLQALEQVYFDPASDHEDMSKDAQERLQQMSSLSLPKSQLDEILDDDLGLETNLELLGDAIHR